MPGRLGDPTNARMPTEVKPLSSTRGINLTCPEWSEHLTHVTGWFAAHPTFMFALRSIKQQRQARICISFAVKCLPDSAHPDLAAVRAQLHDEEATSHTKSMTSTPAYCLVVYFSSTEGSIRGRFKSLELSCCRQKTLARVLRQQAAQPNPSA
jgi:hypothetical protein